METLKKVDVSFPRNMVRVYNRDKSVIVVDHGIYLIRHREDDGGWSRGILIPPELLTVLKSLPEDPEAALLEANLFNEEATAEVIRDEDLEEHCDCPH